MEDLLSLSLHDKNTMQPEVRLPNEIKLMIFKNCTLASLKTLRLVSKSWAAVGLDILLLPTFVISPHRRDISRLLNISQHPTLSCLALKTIRTLEFIGNDWDITIFRNIFSNRTESTSTFMPNSFVPTEEEQKALDELDEYEANMGHFEADGSLDRLVMALEAVPNYHTITIPPRCIFKHKLLQKTWAEYAPGLCIKSSPTPQISHILHAISLANLPPAHLLIPEISAQIALTIPSNFPSIILPALRDIETLSLKIEDLTNVVPDSFAAVYTMLRTFLIPIPKVKALSISITTSDNWTASSLPHPSHWPHLSSLYLSNAEIDGEEFFTFLSHLRFTLTHLQLLGMKITSGSMRWKELLTRLKGTLGLERFQLAHSIWFSEGGEQKEVWHLQPHCNAKWKLYPRGKLGNKSYLIEKFMLEDAEWPMSSEDDVIGMSEREQMSAFIASHIG